ncbi:MAG: zinc metalloprotease HtpX [Melioribacter sp.]|uniref:zinc metalloprotease HtpX n=1 Tax=Rosettibacter primus TaxID=3111523 RepID=UPI00247E5E1A|nr:zinc metalloprotease HtpX [Melioribacter sp.]
MNSVKTVILMTAMMVLFILVGNLIGGQSGMMIAFIISLALNFGSYWFSDKIVLAMYRAHEVTRSEFPELFNIVEKLSSKANLPMPKVYVIDSPTPNAFATGRNPQNGAVAVTTGIMKILNSDELEGVIAHELTHIKNRDILVSTIAATLVGTITFIARMAGWAAMFGGSNRDDRDNGNIFYELALIIIAPIAAMLIQLAISRSREFMADEGGALISGKPLGLASALNKLSQANEMIPMHNAGASSAHMFIVNPLSGKSFVKLFSTHPPVEERIARLKEIASGRR